MITRRTWWALFAALNGVAWLPLWLVQTPAILDYPTHAARVYVLVHLDQVPALQQFYRLAWDWMPNLALDGVVFALHQVLPIEQAVKVFVALTQTLLLGGVAYVSWSVDRRRRVLPLVAALFLYNRMLLWGLLNYLFTLGVGLFGVGAWIHLRDRAGLARWLRWPLHVALAPVLFMGHLSGMGVYALAIGGYELGRFVEDLKARRLPAFGQWALMFGQFALPAYILLALSPTGEGAEDTPFVDWGSVGHKARSVYGLFHNDHLVLDSATFLLVGLVLVVGFWRGYLALERRLIGPAAVLTVAFVAMPAVLFAAYAADQRLAVPVALLWVAALRLRRPPDRAVRLALVGCAALLLVRQGALVASWRAADADFRDYRAALSHLPEGQMLNTALVYEDEWEVMPVPAAHLSCFAIIDHAAFVPTLFAIRNQHPVNFLDAVHHVARDPRSETIRRHGEQTDWDYVREHYDYHLGWHEERYREPPTHGFELVAEYGAARLYKVR